MDTDKYIKHLRKNNYSESTIKTYKCVLRKFEDKYNDIRSIKNIIKYSSTNPNTVTTHYSIIHSYMKWSRDRRIHSLEEYKLPHKPMLYRDVITKNRLYKKTENLEDQNNLIIRFLFETGLRANELNNIIKINKNTIEVLGKGNKVREVFHNFETTKLIDNFEINYKKLNAAVKKTLGPNATPHMLRRSHGTYLLLNGANPKMVMRQMGHNDINTTFRYLQLSKTQSKNMYKRLF